MIRTLTGLCLVAAAATGADAVWYGFGVQHTVFAGVLHGALLLTVVGGVLGAAANRVARGLPLGTLSGVGGAVIYFVLTATVDPRPYGSAIPVAWFSMWLILAVLDGRWLRLPHRRSWRAVVVRGLIAAVCAGAAFALVMNILWGPPPPTGRNYLLQFAAWAFAWAPGVVALTYDRLPLAGRDPSRTGQRLVR